MRYGWKWRPVHVASFGLCLELYELSGWWATDFEYNQDGKLVIDGFCPAYDLSYLLSKLPSMAYVQVGLGGYVAALQESEADHKYPCFGDTPEDAVCTFAIQLFKQGVLKREAHV